MDNKYKEAADPPEEYSPKKKKINKHIKTSHFMDKHLLKFVTYKPCHIYVAFFHLGNLSKLTSEENILWNHWNLHKLNTSSTTC